MTSRQEKERERRMEDSVTMGTLRMLHGQG